MLLPDSLGTRIGRARDLRDRAVTRMREFLDGPRHTCLQRGATLDREGEHQGGPPGASSTRWDVCDAGGALAVPAGARA